MKSTITINQGYYFPLPFRLFGGALPFFAIVFIASDNYIMAALALAMAFLLITTCYELIIDFHKKKYQEHLKILGFKRGDEIAFHTIEKVIFQNRTKSKTYNSRGSTSTVRYSAYTLSLIIDGENVELLESEKESKVKKLYKKLEQHLTTVPVVQPG